jgi:hypothetical protein
MTKKFFLYLLLSLCCTVGLFSFEIGLVGGNISKPSHTIYGISGGMGMLVPMIKIEVEFLKVREPELLEYPNIMTLAIKFRPKLGKFAPYGVLGVGAAFESLQFDLKDYDKFTFVGGGVHYYVAGMFSLRGDIRFMNYSGFNRTRLTGGIFLHF